MEILLLLVTWSAILLFFFSIFYYAIFSIVIWRRQWRSINANSLFDRTKQKTMKDMRRDRDVTPE